MEGKVDGPFLDLVLLCEARGMSKLNQLCAPGEVVHVKIDDTWEAWINPHRVEGRVPLDPDHMHGPVPPFSAWINYNGWLWGLVNPYGGTVGAHPNPEGANQERFARDCNAAALHATAEATP